MKKIKNLLAIKIISLFILATFLLPDFAYSSEVSHLRVPIGIKRLQKIWEKCRRESIPLWIFSNHGDIKDILRKIRKSNLHKKIVVLNFDAHKDKTKGSSSLDGRWAYEVEDEEIVERVIHMETFWKREKGIKEKWQERGDIDDIKNILEERML